MGLNNQGLENHCREILQWRRIANKIVILCEGSIRALQGRRSPSAYRQMEKMPDANFYRACVPKEWQNKIPVFINCGDRSDVLATYIHLKDLHEDSPNNSYLNPDLLFAFVDLDLQIQNIEQYTHQNTEEIFQNLYSSFDLNSNICPKHKIFTTGLIYKEAYFLLPDLQLLFSEHLSNKNFPLPQYKDAPLSLKVVHKDILENLEQDNNLKANLEVVKNRLGFCEELNFSNISSLQQSLSSTANDSLFPYKLLLISQVKDYWNSIKPSEDFSGSLETWREQLLLEIGRFYANSSNRKHHITAILKEIYHHYY